ncbi:MAG TPA: TadE/TadG family type IV pilus assembly protein [Desulfobacteria bacterium]|nr:TadE/TadG family type IV pilus assembly protein [Desulfobacteria bacterium]
MIRLIRDNRGQALVEMALVLPIFILTLLGILEFGRLFSGELELQNAARDLVRFAAVSKSIEIPDDAENWIKANRLNLLQPSKLHVTGFTRTSGSNKYVEVTVQYEMDILTPVISSILGNPYTLNAKMAIRSEV